MTIVQDILTWLGIASAIGGAGMTYGLLRGRVNEQERRIESLEKRADKTDDHFAVITEIKAHLEWMRKAIERLTDER